LSINSRIKTLSVGSYNSKLDTDLLNPLVVERLASLTCDGTVNLVQTDLFKHFEQLSYISVQLTCPGNFYQDIGINWIKYLNNSTYVSLSSIFLPYYYPNRDFCIFATQFPKNKTIKLNLNIENGTNCTLIYAWLCHNKAIGGN
jgi:hypothetical protein